MTLALTPEVLDEGQIDANDLDLEDEVNFEPEEYAEPELTREQKSQQKAVDKAVRSAHEKIRSNKGRGLRGIFDPLVVGSSPAVREVVANLVEDFGPFAGDIAYYAGFVAGQQLNYKAPVKTAAKKSTRRK